MLHLTHYTPIRWISTRPRRQQPDFILLRFTTHISMPHQLQSPSRPTPYTVLPSHSLHSPPRPTHNSLLPAPLTTPLSPPPQYDHQLLNSTTMPPPPPPPRPHHGSALHRRVLTNNPHHIISPPLLWLTDTYTERCSDIDDGVLDKYFFAVGVG